MAELITEPVSVVLVAALVALSQMWQSFMLSKVHTLVNSNFTEAKAARLAAEKALLTSQVLNTHLQNEIALIRQQPQVITVTAPPVE